MKPGAKQFQIEFASGQAYEPDFVVETKAEKLIVEAANEMADPIVQAKSRAATKWVGSIEHAKENRSKPLAVRAGASRCDRPSATKLGVMARYGMEGGS